MSKNMKVITGLFATLLFGSVVMLPQLAEARSFHCHRGYVRHGHHCVRIHHPHHDYR